MLKYFAYTQKEKPYYENEKKEASDGKTPKLL